MKTVIHPKVASATLAGAVVTLLLWVLHAVTGNQPDPEVVAAILVVVTFGAGYIKSS